MLRIGIQCCVDAVAKLMKMAGISARTKSRPRVAATDSDDNASIAPNLLKQQFRVELSTQVWLTDLTYIPTTEAFTYLRPIEDLASPKIIGWSGRGHIDTVLIDGIAGTLSLELVPELSAEEVRLSL